MYSNLKSYQQSRECLEVRTTYRFLNCLQHFAGAQCDRAAELFEQMQQQGCVPDVVTFTALISAYEKGGL